MKDKHKKLEETEQMFVAAVKRHLDGEKVTPPRSGWSPTGLYGLKPGQRVWSGQANTLLSGGTTSSKRSYYS